MPEHITLTLTKAEAISLMPVLLRFHDADRLEITCEADRLALYDLCASLQSHLGRELTSPDWSALLKAAQSEVVEGEHL